MPAAGGNADPLSDEQALPRAPLFVRRLLRHRVLAEQGLTQPVPRILYLRRRWQRLVGAGAAVLGLFWLVGMLWIWQAERQQADTLAGLLHELKAEPHSGLLDDAGARHSISGFWTVLNDAPRWRFSSVLLPGSLFSSLDSQLRQQLRDLAGERLYQPLYAALQRDMGSITAAHLDSQRHRSGDADSPEEWSSYLGARQLLDQVIALEQQSAHFNQMLAGAKSPLDDAAVLSGELLDLELNAQALPLHNRYNWLLAHSAQSLASPVALAPSASRPANSTFC